MEEKKVVLALVGMSGSGKSSVAKLLKNWEIVRLGDITMIEITNRNMPVNEANERLIREELREKYGKEAYAKLSVSRINNALKKKDTVIDGLYSWSEYKLLKKELDVIFKTLLIYTDKHIRYHRLMTREERPLTLNEAISRDISEIENLEKGGPIAFTDFLLMNNGTHEELKQNLKEILHKIKH